MKKAFVCDWLTGMRGGERCLEAVCELYPEADIFTLVHVPGSVSETIESHTIITSYIQDLPGNKENFRIYLPLFPNAIRRFDMGSYDLVISFSHCVAKGVKVPNGIPHICYCHTPMRYAWHMRDEYLSNFNKPKKLFANIILNYLKHCDRKTSLRVTNFIANSRYTQNRIKQAYNRDSFVIYPPVDCKRFVLCAEDDNYYLIVSALVPYKRVDLAVATFNGLDQKLIIVGKGPDLPRLKNMASANIYFIENADDSEVVEYMKKCKALLFPGEEDFGIVPLEAQACGKPVIAFGKGGALETVIGLAHTQEQAEKINTTGMFFYEQKPRILQNTILKFESMRDKFLPDNCRNNALRFDRPVYQGLMRKFIQHVIVEH